MDLSMLSNATYVNDKPCARGYLFFERIKREVARGFPSMHTADSIVTPTPRVRDPQTNKRMKIVSWPPTEKEKTIPLVNLEALAQSQIRPTEKYEDVAKGWTSVVATVLHISKKGFGGYKDKLEGSGGSGGC
ncbi:hypothetical protein Hanom_Chr02g00168031 [Helianthus anomalus]